MAHRLKQILLTFKLDASRYGLTISKFTAGQRLADGSGLLLVPLARANGMYDG